MAINVAMVAPFDAEMKFPLGQLAITPAALQALVAARQSPIALLLRHSAGDWGAVDASDWKANDRALSEGDRLLSAYEVGNDTTIWLITEHDRSATTILLPED
jgi:hypothetical protein